MFNFIYPIEWNWSRKKNTVSWKLAAQFSNDISSSLGSIFIILWIGTFLLLSPSKSTCGKLSIPSPIICFCLILIDLALSKLDFSPGFLRILDSQLFNRFQIVKTRKTSHLGFQSSRVFILVSIDITDDVQHWSFFLPMTWKFFHESQLVKVKFDALIRWSISNGLSFRHRNTKLFRSRIHNQT